MAEEKLSPKARAAQEFGRMYVEALVQNAKLPAEPGYFTLRQDDLANIAAAAFEVGAQWRQDSSGCERGRGSVMACGSSPMCGCPAALAELERNPDAFGVAACPTCGKQENKFCSNPWHIASGVVGTSTNLIGAAVAVPENNLAGSVTSGVAIPDGGRDDRT